jgi:hypothetical protein
MWTPTLDSYYPNLNHGLIFACFMVAVMIGSSIFKLGGSFYTKELILLYMFGAAAIAFAVPVLFQDGFLILMSFLLFEGTVGVFWPCMGTLKGTYIPEDVRGTVMNYFRVPTNFFVLVILNQVKKLSTPLVFFICLALILVSTGTAYYIHSQGNAQKKKTVVDMEAIPVHETDFDDAPSQETYNS